MDYVICILDGIIIIHNIVFVSLEYFGFGFGYEYGYLFRP